MEGLIKFPPTYKFDPYTNVYDTSKKDLYILYLVMVLMML
jgi:hypothetical protein